MRTDRDPSDAVEAVELPELTVIRNLRNPKLDSNEPQRLTLVLAADSPRFTIVAIGTSSSRALGTRAKDARGCALAEVLWLTTSDGSGIDTVALTASFERVMATGKPEAMQLRRCHITHPSTRTGADAQRWWSVINFPMVGASGRVTHIVQRIEDVTETAQMQLANDLRLQPASDPFLRRRRTHDKSRSTLLVVGMAEQDRERLHAEIGEHGYRLLSASNERAALASCAQEPPDCILVDLSAAELDGVRLCRALRDQAAQTDTAIVCLAQSWSTAMLDKLLLAGADDVLEKPIAPHELVHHIQAVLLHQPDMTEPLRMHCQHLRQQRLRLCRLQRQREGERPLFCGRLEPRYEMVDLFQVVRELLTDFDARAQARALTLRSDIEVSRVFADRDLLRRVLANLLNIAILRAPNNSEVAIMARHIGGSRIELRVLDAGAPISPEMVERIFDEHEEGAAQGLAFCKLAAESHHGEISVHTLQGRTVFAIKLPQSFK